MGESFTTNIQFGGMLSGTRISNTDSVQSVVRNILNNPNVGYESINIGTWNTQSDIDTFFALHNHDNDYNGLKLGNIITIKDGTYNVDWEIAGFDCEYNQTAADGTVYNNGYGICLIPKTFIDDQNWNNTSARIVAYMDSTMHTSHLVTIANNLKNVLGNHLINRNVLLSSSTDSSYYSNAYTWTTAYATLMSAGQLTGTFGQHRNQYDDGEANYKLPLFNYEDYKIDSQFWLRGIWGIFSTNRCAWGVNYDGSIVRFNIINPYYVRPLIYLR